MFLRFLCKISGCYKKFFFQVIVEATGDVRKAVPEPPAAHPERLLRRGAADPVDGLHVPEHVPLHQRHDGQAQHDPEMCPPELRSGAPQSRFAHWTMFGQFDQFFGKKLDFLLKRCLFIVFCA
jgi:hypothetical protein